MAAPYHQGTLANPMLVALCISALTGFGPVASSVHAAAGSSMPPSYLGRRAFAGAVIPALFLGVVPAANAAPGDIRKANQDAIGVSRVTIPKKAEGNKGAGVIPVDIDTSGWKGISGKQESVIGPGGADGGSPNGFLCLGDRDCYKKAENAKASKKAVETP